MFLGGGGKVKENLKIIPSGLPMRTLFVELWDILNFELKSLNFTAVMKCTSC